MAKYSKMVYGCPACFYECWSLNNEKRPGVAKKCCTWYPVICKNSECRKKYTWGETIFFPSEIENVHAIRRKEQEKAGKIKHLELHPRFVLNDAADWHYTADIRYTLPGAPHTWIVEDVKQINPKTGTPWLINRAEFRRKCKAMWNYQRLKVDIIAGGLRWRWDSGFKKLEVVT